MASPCNFDARVFLERLARLNVEVIHDIPFADLEWMLPDFILSWGQRFPFEPQTWRPIIQRSALQHMGSVLLPFSTASDFPAVTARQVRILALAVTFFSLQTMLLDAVIDDPETTPAGARMLIQPLGLRAYRQLHQIFPEESSLWDELEWLACLTSQSLLEDYQRCKGQVRTFPLMEYKRIAYGKTAGMQLNGIALAILGQAREHIPTLIECWKTIGFALTVCDDICDWQEDYYNANYTYLLSQVLPVSPFLQEIEEGKFPTVSEVGAALLCTNSVEELYLLAIEESRRAGDLALKIHCSALSNVLKKFERRMQAMSERFFHQKMTALLMMNTTHV